MKYTTTEGQLFFFAIVKNAPTDFVDEANTTALKKKHFQGNISKILCLRSIWTWAQNSAYFITLDLPISATKKQVWRRYIEVAKQASQLGWEIHIFFRAKIQLDRPKNWQKPKLGGLNIYLIAGVHLTNLILILIRWTRCSFLLLWWSLVVVMSLFKLVVVMFDLPDLRGRTKAQETKSFWRKVKWSVFQSIFILVQQIIIKCSTKLLLITLYPKTRQ